MKVLALGLPVALTSLPDLPAQPPPVQPDVCVVGSWDRKFEHKMTATTGAPLNTPFQLPPQFQVPPNKMFNALHMAMIPTGQNRGKVIVWDGHYPGPNQTNNNQRWSIVDPVTEDMLNYDLTMPTSAGDLFCSGHVWTTDGNLFVAGGTTQYLPTTTGGKLAYIWDPVSLGWTRQTDLVEPRWYPTVTMDHNDKLIVTGGVRSIVNNVAVPTNPDPNWRQFTTPVSRSLAPRGYYMMFLVNNHGVPSQAYWVQLT